MAHEHGATGAILNMLFQQAIAVGKRIRTDTHIAYHERTAGQHYENLKNGSPLVIAFANLEKKQGYRFRGNVVLHVDDDIYNEQVKGAEEKGTKKPAVIPVLEVTEIQDLASGPTAGKTIAKD